MKELQFYIYIYIYNIYIYIYIYIYVYIKLPGTVNCSRFPSYQRKCELIYSVVFTVFGRQVKQIKI